VGSRKIYAIPSSEFENQSNSSPIPKRRRFSNTNTSKSKHFEAPALETAVENLITEVSDVRNEISKYRQLAFKHKFSLSFISAIEGAFECAICKSTPAKPPLIGCSSCCSLVGCQECTNTWYGQEEALDKVCPKCRAERGLTKTFVIKGFDDLIDQITEMNKTEADGAFDDTLPVEDN